VRPDHDDIPRVSRGNAVENPIKDGGSADVHAGLIGATKAAGLPTCQHHHVEGLRHSFSVADDSANASRVLLRTATFIKQLVLDWIMGAGQ
jgi:hypothetical protein